MSRGEYCSQQFILREFFFGYSAYITVTCYCNCRFCLYFLSLICCVQNLDVLNRTLVIGRRWNVRWSNLTLHLPEQVTHIGKTCGKIHKEHAVDYFIIAKNEFPWAHLPDVVIARRGYDNFLVMLAVQENVSVVDISDTVVAVHQTDADAQDKRRHVVQHEFNMRRLPRFLFTKGMTSRSQYLTKAVTDTLRSNKTNIVVLHRYVNGTTITGARLDR